MLGDRRQTQDMAHYRVLLIWHSDTGRTTGTAGAGSWGGRDYRRAVGNMWADGSVFHLDHNSMHFSEPTESYTEKAVLLYANHTIKSNLKNAYKAQERPWGFNFLCMEAHPSASDCQSGFCWIQPLGSRGRREKAGLSAPWPLPWGGAGAPAGAAPAVAASGASSSLGVSFQVALSLSSPQSTAKERRGKKGEREKKEWKEKKKAQSQINLSTFPYNTDVQDLGVKRIPKKPKDFRCLNRKGFIFLTQDFFFCNSKFLILKQHKSMASSNVGKALRNYLILCSR